MYRLFSKNINNSDLRNIKKTPVVPNLTPVVPNLTPVVPNLTPVVHQNPSKKPLSYIFF